MFSSAHYRDLFERIDAVRRHRDGFLEELSTGALDLDALFARADTDAVIASMKVLPAVEALPDSGKVQTRRAFEELGIAEDGHLVHVMPAQRTALPAAMERHAR